MKKSIQDGALFGKGIYFSDCVTKSSNYADNFMFLCEVGLGKMKLYKAHETRREWKDEYGDSAFGHGSYAPQPEK